MKRILRTTLGILFIAFGAGIVYLSFGLFPKPVELGAILVVFLPVIGVGVGIVGLGWGIIHGMTWREFVNYITSLW